MIKFTWCDCTTSHPSYLPLLEFVLATGGQIFCLNLRIFYISFFRKPIATITTHKDAFVNLKACFLEKKSWNRKVADIYCNTVNVPLRLLVTGGSPDSWQPVSKRLLESAVTTVKFTLVCTVNSFFSFFVLRGTVRSILYALWLKRFLFLM